MSKVHTITDNGRHIKQDKAKQSKSTNSLFLREGDDCKTTMDMDYIPKSRQTYIQQTMDNGLNINRTV